MDFLRLAGFWEEPGDGGDDRALVFDGDPTSSAFGRVQECLRGALAAVGGAVPASVGGPALPRSGSSSQDLGSLHREAREKRRRRIAELTEERLKDPRKFHEAAKARGARLRSAGGGLPKAKPKDSASGAPARRAKHFTLSDIDRLRVEEEIASAPSYADEYRAQRHSTPAHDLRSLSARGEDPQLIARQALDGTNRYRASKGLAPLRWNEGIAQIAAEHAAQMAAGQMPFNHDGFNQRASRFPLAHSGAGENLAMSHGYSEVAQTAVDGWIKSPGHEKNLRGQFNVCGIGCACSNGKWYTTQLFARAA